MYCIAQGALLNIFSNLYGWRSDKNEYMYNAALYCTPETNTML